MNIKIFRIFLIVAVLVVLNSAAQADDLFVSPSGNDTNDCLSRISPCLTLQAAANKSVATMTSNAQGILLADGAYTMGADVSHFKHINFVGNCENPDAVVIKNPDGSVFFTQDHATLILQCMRIDAPNGAAIIARQFSIVDYVNVIFGPAIQHVHATEMSKINCASATIDGNAIYHAKASGGSTISLTCPITINDGVSVSAFIYASEYSIVNFAGAVVSGILKKGAQYINDGSRIIYGETAKPGYFHGNICQHGCYIQESQIQNLTRPLSNEVPIEYYSGRELLNALFLRIYNRITGNHNPDG